MDSLSPKDPETVWVPYFDRHMTYSELRRVDVNDRQRACEECIASDELMIRDGFKVELPGLAVLLLLVSLVTVGQLLFLCAYISMHVGFLDGADNDPLRLYLVVAAIVVLVAHGIAAWVSHMTIRDNNNDPGELFTHLGVLVYGGTVEIGVVVWFVVERFGYTQLGDFRDIGSLFVLAGLVLLVLIGDGFATFGAFLYLNQCRLRLKGMKESLHTWRHRLARIPELRMQVEDAKLRPEPVPPPVPPPAPPPAIPPTPRLPKAPAWSSLQPEPKLPGLPPANVPLAPYKKKREPEPPKPVYGNYREDLKKLYQKPDEPHPDEPHPDEPHPDEPHPDA